VRSAILVTLVLSVSQPAFAQLASTSNAKGVAFGHLHFSTQDIAAFRNFWVALGGTSTPNLDLDLVQLPGVYLVTFQRDQIAPMDEETTPMVTFKVKNGGALPHDFKVCSSPKGGSANSCAGRSTPLLSPGQSATLTVTFKTAGTYEYQCAVSGHAAAGMKGDIKVN